MHHEEAMLSGQALMAFRKNIAQLSAPTTFQNAALGDPSTEIRNAQKPAPKKSRTHNPPIYTRNPTTCHYFKKIHHPGGHEPHPVKNQGPILQHKTIQNNFNMSKSSEQAKNKIFNLYLGAPILWGIFQRRS